MFVPCSQGVREVLLWCVACLPCVCDVCTKYAQGLLYVSGASQARVRDVRACEVYDDCLCQVCRRCMHGAFLRESKVCLRRFLPAVCRLCRLRACKVGVRYVFGV